MFRKSKKVALAALLSLLPAYNSAAIDFDQDGFDDFITVTINNKNRLDWFAIDINDPAKRPLGQFGKAGDHLAVGNWTGNSQSSKALVKKKDSGDFEWNIQLANGQRNLAFGKYPDTVMSGLDVDKNGAIDPALVTPSGKKLAWKIMTNPAELGSVPAIKEVTFGGKKELPFYANIDGKGDKIATAKVNGNGSLSLRYLNLSDGKIKTVTVKNFKASVSKILPVALPNGKDALFAISKRGKKIIASIIKGNKKIKTIKVSGDEIVVGRYLGSNREVLVVRNNANKATFIETSGKKSSMAIDISSVLVDEVNINSFKNNAGKPEPTPGNPEPAPAPVPTAGPPASGNQDYPVCAGAALSTDHMLYKPISDTTGNAVLVFDSKYSREFLAVKIELKDGSFAEGWWEGLELWGNPDAFGNRQHWRTNVRSSQIKDNARIIVDDTSQQCVFVLPGSANKRWE